jgi:hypothetical protein
VEEVDLYRERRRVVGRKRMKIQCDVCDKEQANVFCPADEAALCDGCDHSIHHANKLASQHTRFSLRHPSFKEAPLCDICQVLLTAHSSSFSYSLTKETKDFFFAGWCLAISVVYNLLEKS